jgi:hypothetical protein
VYREDVFHNFSNAVRGFCCVLRDMVRPTFLEALMTKTFFRLCAVALLAAPLASNATQAQTSAIPRPAPSPAADYGRLPLSFEPNRGQADPSVQFLSRGSHYIVLLQPNTATLLLDRTAAKSALQPAPSQRSAIRMTLKGSSPTATMSPEKPLAGYVNYLTGDKSHSYTGLPTYAATRVASAYQGIDVVYYGTDRQLEYDFVVAPHSDPAQIHLAIDGAHPTLEADGTVRLQIALPKRDTDIIFHKPVLYQQIDGKRHPIDGAFSVAANGEISFRVGSYDPARELIIDPVIGYGSYFGGNVQDEINGSALNASNQLYAVGQTLSPTLFSTSGEFQSGPYGGVQRGWDGFVTKFSADGSTVLWTTYLAGSGDDFATAVAVNSSDQAYVVGNTDSCLYASEAEPNQNNDPNAALPIVHFPVTSDAVQQLCSPNVSYLNQNPSAPYESEGTNTTTFLAKLSSDGKTELYGTPIGGSSGDYASSIVLDATGRPYIVGETYSTAYVKCSTAKTDCDVPSYPVDQHGNADIGLANYPTTSNAFYSSTIESQTYPTLCVGCPPTQDEQAFITVLSADLHSFVYSSLIGGPVIGGCGNGACNTNGIAVAVNAAGQAFIGGNTSSAHWPVTAGAFAATCPNAGAATSQCPMTGWLAGFDPSKSGAASLLFTTYLTGSSAGLDSNGNPLYPGGDVYGLAVDSKGNVVATGDTNADNFPTTAGTFEPTCVQFSDGNGNSKRCQSAYITKLSPTGATVWSTYFTPRTQPGNFVIGNGVALDANDDVFVVGTSTSPTLPLVHPISTNPAQNDDAFVIEISPTGATELMGTYLGANGNLTVDNNSLHLDSSLNAYISGYQGFCTNCTITFPTTPRAPATGSTGGSVDGWVLKLITQQQTPSTALQITPNSAAPGVSIGFTATVTGLSGFAVPTGTVILSNGSNTLGTITLSNGTGTFSTAALAAGTYSVIATYSGDTVYATSATTAQTLSIQSTPAIALTATPSTATIGTAIALKATLSSTAGTPTGTVYFMDGTNTLGSMTLSGGSASYSATALAGGPHSITARYSGDGSFVAVTSTAQTVTINLITPSVALTATPSTATAGTAIALNATVTGTGATPTGTVKFYDGSSLLSTFTLAGTSGVATYSATALAVGPHSITAAYSGDGNFTAVTSAGQAVTINAVPPTISLAANPSSLTIKSGSTGTTVITVTPAGGYTGTLTFACGSLPSAASCSFAPATLTFTGAATAQTSTLTFSTVSAHAALKMPFDRRLPMAALATLLLLPWAMRRRSRLKGILPALVLMGSLALLAVSGCGSPAGPTTVDTPVGPYSVPVNVTGATSTNTLSLQITVQ